MAKHDADLQLFCMKPKALALFLTLLVSANSFAAELTVQAAASLTDVMKEIGKAYEKESGDHLVLVFGASSMLARQIAAGAPADLFLSADEAKMDALEKKGLLLEGTRRSLLSNALVIVVATEAKTNLSSVSDLTRPEYKAIGMAEPKTVPAGLYASEYLQKRGLWNALQHKIVPTDSVRSALAAVASGNVEAAFVYKTDVVNSKKVRIAIEIPAAEGPKISYPLAVMKSSRQSDRAKKLAEYLVGPAARQLFGEFGFIVPR